MQRERKKSFFEESEPGWTRTIDTILKRDVLYHLSYGP